MSTELKLPDYTEFKINSDLTDSSSTLNEFEFEDTIAFDQSYEGVPGQNMLFYGMPIRKKTFESTQAGIWMGVDTDGRAKVNIGDANFSLIWDGLALYVTGEIIIYPDPLFGESVRINGLGISFWDGADETLEFAVSDIGTGQGTIYFFDKGNPTPVGTMYGNNDSGDNIVEITAEDGLRITTPSIYGAGASMALDGGLAVRFSSAPVAGGSASILISNVTGFGIYAGTGAPTVSAAKGSLYLRRDGTGTNDRAYINTDGGTTWTAIVTVA